MKRKIAMFGLSLLGIVVLLLILWQVGSGTLGRKGLYLDKSRYEAQAVERTAGLPIQYADSISCGQCHQGRHEQWEQSQHSGVACEACHGPGQAHVEGNATLYRPVSREACGACHDKLAGRPTSFPQVSLTQHYPESACVSCHNPMGSPTGAEAVPTSTPAQSTVALGPPGITHTLEGRSQCLGCHQSGVMKAPLVPASHAGYTNDGCQGCHRGKSP